MHLKKTIFIIIFALFFLGYAYLYWPKERIRTTLLSWGNIEEVEGICIKISIKDAGEIDLSKGELRMQNITIRDKDGDNFLDPERKETGSNYIITPNEIEIRGGNSTIFYQNREKGVIAINKDEDEEFEEVRIRTNVTKEPAILLDEDEDGKYEKIALTNNQREILLIERVGEKYHISTDINRNGVKEMEVTILPNGSYTYSINYVEVAFVMGKDILKVLNALISTRNYQKALEVIKDVLSSKYPEEFRIINESIYKYNEILKLFNYTFSLPSMSKVVERETASKSITCMDVVKEYYQRIKEKKEVADLFDEMVDKQTLTELHQSIYKRINFTKISVVGINCFNTSNITICKYHLTGEFVDVEGNIEKINQSYVTFLNPEGCKIIQTIPIKNG